MFTLPFAPLLGVLRLIHPRRHRRRGRAPVQSRPVPGPASVPKVPKSKDRAEESPTPKAPSDELDLGGKWLEL
jgi:hypothetical protein